jgi:hypothetical protein
MQERKDDGSPLSLLGCSMELQRTEHSEAQSQVKYTRTAWFCQAKIRKGFRSESIAPGTSEREYCDLLAQILGQAVVGMGCMSLWTVFWRQLRSG